MKDSIKQQRDNKAHTIKDANNEKYRVKKNEKNYKGAKQTMYGVQQIGGILGYRELRNNISEVIENVISDYNVVISGNVKKSSKKTAAIISTQILGDILSVYEFKPAISFDKATNQYEVILKEINVYGYGDTKEEAVEMTTDMAIDITEDYFNNADMYARIPSERSKYPYFLRIRNCSERAEVKKVLGLVD